MFPIDRVPYRVGENFEFKISEKKQCFQSIASPTEQETPKIQQDICGYRQFPIDRVPYRVGETKKGFSLTSTGSFQSIASPTEQERQMLVGIV